jgi:hypothetical protein
MSHDKTGVYRARRYNRVVFLSSGKYKFVKVPDIAIIFEDRRLMRS